MKLQVLQENLSKALITASRFSSARAQLPVLGNILLSAKKTKLLVSSTNLETSISISLGAQVKEEGELTIPSKVVTEIVSNLPLGPIDLESEEEHLKIISPNFSSKISGMNSADFPDVPKSVAKEGSILLNKNDFAKAISQVILSVSVDETRPVLTGVLFIFSKDNLVLVATDGFRLSQKKVLLKGSDANFKVIVPRNPLMEISKIGEGEEETIFSFKEKDSQVIFGVGEITLSSRILDGTYPDFEKIIPKSLPLKVRLDREEITRAVRVASVFARDSANIVKFSLLKDSLKISAQSSQSGTQETKVEAKIEGEVPKDFEIAFNYRFLEDFLKTVEGGEILCEFSNPNAPGVFTDPKDSNYLHLIMPVKIQG